MYFCYFDESGDSGYEKSPSKTFTLATVIVHERDWLNTLDQLVSFRRYLRDNFGIPPRTEIKSNWLLQTKGPFKQLGLSPAAKMAVYRAAMRFQRKCGTIRTFAVVINKERIVRKDVDSRNWAWRWAIQRVERFGTASNENMHILPDEGHGYFIKKMIRDMRRYHQAPSAYGPEKLDRPAKNIVEDSSDRQSHESYFIQLADLNAYAAFRKVHPSNFFDGAMWDELGDIRISDVNSIRGGPTGIVSWP
jgi:hypothetical protein